MATVFLTLVLLCASCSAAAQQQNGSDYSLPLRSSVAVAQLESPDGSCPAATEVESVQNTVTNDIQPTLLNVSASVLESSCTSRELGLTQDCPAASCDEILDQDNMVFHFTSYYWISEDNGNAVQMHCEFDSQSFQHTSAEINQPSSDDSTCPVAQQIGHAYESIKQNVLSKLPEIARNVLPCTSDIAGLVAHCPINNCSSLFNALAEDSSSSYYWLSVSNCDYTS